MGFVLQFQGALQAELTLQALTPPGVDVLHQVQADARRVFLGMGAAEPDEGGVGVAVDHFITPGFNQFASLAHDLVATQGDGRRQPRVEEAATAGTEHAVEGVHDDLQCL